MHPDCRRRFEGEAWREGVRAVRRRLARRAAPVRPRRRLTAEERRRAAFFLALGLLRAEQLAVLVPAMRMEGRA
jgi:hypothetical protein